MIQTLTKEKDQEILEDIDCILYKTNCWKYSNLAEEWQYSFSVGNQTIALNKYTTGYAIRIGAVQFMLPDEYKEKVENMIENNLRKNRERSIMDARIILRNLTKNRRWYSNNV